MPTVSDGERRISSKRPYLIRAMHEWLSANGHTPHLVVDAEDLVVDDVFLVNVKAGYEFSNYRVGLFVNNLLDEDFLTAIFGSDLAVVGDGRAFGVELLANF